ncbi:MAG: porin family protein [Deltaproteobacteria bacterium]|nr:porin family protein [Deltaproteobacteria bacterium]
MKKNVILVGILFLVLTVGSAFGTTEKGTKEFEWNFELNKFNFENKDLEYEATQTSWGGRILLGYFFTKKLELGGSFRAEYSTWEETQEGSSFEITTIDYEPGLILRYFFLSGRTRPYLGAGVSYSKLEREDDEGDKTTVTSTKYNLPVGLKYFVSEKTAINAEYNFGYKDYTYDSESDDDVDSAEGITIQNTFSLGISVFF